MIRRDPAASGVVTLLSDFGLEDAYVAAMKGVLISAKPDVRLVDVTHLIPAQDVEAAAWVLASGYRWFPEGTVHLAVVDPGVGTDRAAIALRADGHFFVAPDNGLLTPLLDRATEGDVRRLAAPEGASPTFHGRDVFAPAAARLAGGAPFESLGEPYAGATVRPELTPTPFGERGERGVRGRIWHVDRFGNAITTIRARDVEALGQDVQIEVRGERIEGVARTYADVGVGEIVALIGSAGALEIAIRNGDAAGELGLDRGDPVTVIRRSAAR